MKQLQITEPEYVQRFSCVGSACRDHCCKRWSITLDKKTYNKYIKSQDAEIKRIAVTNIVVNKKDHAKWATIQLNEDHNCPYLDEQSLCNVHKRLGVEALSRTCADYPRIERVYKQETQRSLTLSCPEVVRQVLFNPTALNMSTSSVIRADYAKAPEANLEGRLINLFCANLLMPEQVQIEQNLYSVASFLLHCQKLTGDTESKLAEMEAVYEHLTGKLHSGDVAGYLAGLPYNGHMQWQLLIRLQQFITEFPGTRGRETLFIYLSKLIKNLVNDFDNDQVNEKMQQLGSIWNNQALPFFQQQPHILRNYFLYRLHHDQFAINSDVPLLKALYLLVVDFFFIKSLISAHLQQGGELTEDIVIDIFYSYHAFRQHTLQATKKFIGEIDKVKVNDDLSLLQLLV
ncbi:flagellin lysine-N-methylase [Yersinia aleksiciae]|uniref:Flagellar protein FliB n=1 Tax=Yersinia aleksiciae TaxID=263819 RepID=A0ABM5U8U9_YERAE|nr:flagellin lysine-N-methylase [Yersinia aleksiciae]AKP32213.1 flagellar protein FliB [Yersinia aleksiciae]CFQ34579.1 flagellin lysine-N-methylase [Yersinia aleksiciae]